MKTVNENINIHKPLFVIITQVIQNSKYVYGYDSRDPR